MNGYKVDGTLGRQALSIQIEPPVRTWLDVSVYAPALPGVAVALFGLWVSHILARSRDRRKEILDLCESVKELAEKATKSAIEAWISDPSAERKLAIHETKSEIQALGIAATTLQRRSAVSIFSWRRLFRKRTSVDVIKLTAQLRKAATKDPFENATRLSSEKEIGAVTSRRSAILAEVDTAFSELYR